MGTSGVNDFTLDIDGARCMASLDIDAAMTPVVVDDGTGNHACDGTGCCTSPEGLASGMGVLGGGEGCRGCDGGNCKGCDGCFFEA